MPKRPPKGKPFVKGQVANPIGANAHNPVKREFKRLTRQQLREVMTLILRSHPDQLEEARTSPNTTVLKAWIAEAAIRGIENGDLGPLMSIIDRVQGTVEQRWKVKVDPISKLSDEEIQKEIERLRKINGNA